MKYKKDVVLKNNGTFVSQRFETTGQCVGAICKQLFPEFPETLRKRFARCYSYFRLCDCYSRYYH